MCSKCLDTIAREQVRIDFRKVLLYIFVLIIKQIRELTYNTKIGSSTSTGWFYWIKNQHIRNFYFYSARTRSDESRGYIIIIIAMIYIIFAFVIFGRFTINNGTFIREVYYSLIDTSNETLTETPSFFQTIR